MEFCWLWLQVAGLGGRSLGFSIQEMDKVQEFECLSRLTKAQMEVATIDSVDTLEPSGVRTSLETEEESGAPPPTKRPFR
jgi:hypothetical protein